MILGLIGGGYWLIDSAWLAPQADRQGVSSLDALVKAGNPEAEALLAVRHLTLNGVKGDEKETLKLLKSASAKGSALADGWLATCYKEGRLGLKVDESKAKSLALKSARGGCVIGQRFLGLLELQKREKFHWINKAIDHGDSFSKLNMALWMQCHDEISTGFFKTAIELLREAADDGLPVAQYYLAIDYELGIGTRKIRTMALELYEKTDRRQANIDLLKTELLSVSF
ncbi:MAG: sel1 repeat family protein [Candidatus Obscuribacterales bacterium]|nr:sel1 repeat family protein [Candidatus Obscuribacterales bacterium]